MLDARLIRFVSKIVTPNNLITKKAMQMLTRFRRWAIAAILLTAGLAAEAQQTMVTYAGTTGRDRFMSTLRLSDGTVLVAGRSQSLGWVPSSVPVTTLTIPQVPSASFDSVLGINSRDTTNSIAYVLRMNANMTNILSVVRFPSGTVLDVSKIKTNTVPGQTTGDVYISGRRIYPRQRNGATAGNSGFEGYYIAKLNANYLTGTPSGLDWTFDVAALTIRNNTSAYPYYGANSDAGILNNQPWDVTNDGKIWYVTGREFSDDWSALFKVKPVQRNGATVMVSDTASAMPYNRARTVGYSLPSLNGRIIETRYRNVRIGDSVTVTVSQVPYRVIIDSLLQSGIILKINRNGSNSRSYDVNDANLLLNDENGNPGRKGKYPDDYYYAEPCTTGCNGNGPGYTGYSTNTNGNNTATQRVVSITVDKRTNELYFGASTWSRHRYSNPAQDFESSITALGSNGDVKWWARGYKEDTAGSAALQFIDQVELDYTNNQLVVLGRSIGDAQYNFWHGDQITANPGGNGFQNKITGTQAERDVADVRWIGKYRISDGVIVRSTYVGEVAKDATTGTNLTAALMDGWHDPNTGNPALAMTKITKLSLNLDGSIMVVGQSDGRIITTSNAFQKMLKANPNAPTMPGTNTFVRIYNADLSAITYSTLLSNVWDPVTGTGGGTVELTDVIAGATPDHISVVGYHKATTVAPLVSDGGPVPTTNVPTWGSARPEGESALLANLYFTCTAGLPVMPDSLRGPASACANQPGQYIIKKVPGATHYVWALPGTNYTGYSTTDTITISGAAGNGGTLRVVAVNECGAGPAATLVVGRPGNTGRPTSLQLLPSPGLSTTSQCVNSTRWYRISSVTGATSYRWVMPTSGWVPVGAQPTDTVFVSSADSIQIFLADTATRTGLIRVRASGQCGPGLAFGRQFQVTRALIASDSIRRPNGSANAMCAGTNRIYTAGAVTGATSYVWTLPGANWSATSLTTTTPSLTVTAAAGAGGVMTVRAVNSCGQGAPRNLTVPAVNETPINQTIQDNQATTTLSVPRQPGATYQWRRQGVNITGATDTSWNYGTLSGTYTLVITSCGSNITLGPLTSLNDRLTASDIELFPNPTTGKMTFNINGGTAQNVSVRILDVLGRPVLTTGTAKAAEGTTSLDLDLSALSSGLYTAEIVSGDQRVTKRITKQ